MRKQIFSFKDSICIAQPMTKAIRDYALDTVGRGNGTTLKVVIDATHSGVLTNMRVYPGKKVAAGHKSFFSRDNGGMAEFNKPVLKHHESFSDPIGRVINAKYTQLKFGDQFEMDYLNPAPNGEKGSGVVTVEAVIIDEDSIAKIIDGRFVSVSAGHHTDLAMCSICGENILRCEHMPGRRYNADGEPTSNDDANLCYIITNNMTYDELSFVNMPAQPPAKLVNFNWADCKDLRDEENILIESMTTGGKDTVRTLTLCDSEDEINLLTGKKKSDSKKSTIAVNPAIADKLKAALSLPEASDDDTHIRPEEDGKKVEQPEQNLEAVTSNEGKNMDAKELEKLNEQLKSLQDELSVAKTNITTLETTVKAKDDEILRLTEESKQLDSKMRKNLATTLASLRIRLKKPDALDLDTKEKLDGFVDKLATRSLPSLEDAVSDLLVELEHAKETELNKTPAKDAAAIVENNTKLDDPTGKKAGLPTKKTESNKSNPISAIDRELGLNV